MTTSYLNAVNLNDLEYTLTQALAAEVHDCVDAWLESATELESVDYSNLRDEVHEYVTNNLVIEFPKSWTPAP